MDWEAIKQVVLEAVQAMRTMPYEPSRDFKTLWPAMWCEWASIAIAEALHERGLGEWTFIQARPPDDPSGHAWLEYRADDGTVLYSIDATLHQFSRHENPHIGEGRTPAADEFTDVRFEGPWRDWPVIAYKPQYIEFAKMTLRQMRELESA